MHDVHLDWFAACCTSFAAQKQNALGGVAGSVSVMLAFVPVTADDKHTLMPLE